jgi:Uncharacterized protein related to glutamine synthetase
MDTPELFASMVFSDRVMKERLPKKVYEAINRTIEDGQILDISIANAVANAMKEWAVEKGVTHFTHWFQPMTGVTAEKHDSFISPVCSDKILMEFSGKELTKGESDASSFPSGGLRATFEARGYTAWDPTSYVFIKDGVLCIPTIFCSYGGHVLDKKVPLLRSVCAVEKQAMRVLRLFGNRKVQRVYPSVGAEQEYFLVDRELYKKRRDLVLCGRTLFGAAPPRGQKMEAHYFRPLSKRASDYMQDLDVELWKLGVLAKTKHNEAAPAQYELAPIYSKTNTATDHNQLTMETMKKIAPRHGLACLLHEKPFAGINGSGKHNNWSMITDAGVNLFEPGDDPSENAQFLLFLVAVIKAVDDYQDLLRCSVASASNDCRLGGYEAPPPIVSVSVGEELGAILDAIESDSLYAKNGRKSIQIGVKQLPHIPKDTADRNRTSPFAFTGNKFEFRMVGSSTSIAGPNFVLNTIVAESLRVFADELEKSTNFNESLAVLIKREIIAHKKIVFNGDNYSKAWEKEAKRRGLLALNTAVDALPCFVESKNVELFERHGILTTEEVQARYEIMLVDYINTVTVEALTMIDIVRRDILPAVLRYEGDISRACNSKKQLDGNIFCKADTKLVTRLSELSDGLDVLCEDLEKKLESTKAEKSVLSRANSFEKDVLGCMEKMREKADRLEVITPTEYWPMSSYTDLLYDV